MILPADHVLRAGDNALLASFFARLFKMTNFAAKHSIMTPEMVENFCDDYYIPDEDMGLLDLSDCRTGRSPRVKVQKKDDQAVVLLMLFEALFFLSALVSGALDCCSARTLFRFDRGSGMRLSRRIMEVKRGEADIQAHVVQSARITDVPVYTAAAEMGGSSSALEVSAPAEADLATARPEEVATTQSGKSKRKRLVKQSDTLAAKQLRKDHPSFATGTGGKTPEKDLEILRLKSLLVEKAETAEVVRLRGQVSALTGEVSVLKSTVAQKDTDISLLDSRATYLKYALDDSKAACAEVGSLITSLTSERDRLTSEISTLHTAFQDFKKKAKT
ncbi:hypothetical protein Tco_0994699 [Tanacetum coccineum]